MRRFVEQGEQPGIEFMRDARAQFQRKQQRPLERREVPGDRLAGSPVSGVPDAAASAPRMASQARSSRGSAGSSTQTMLRATRSADNAAATTARTGTSGRSGTIVTRVSRSGAANEVAAIGPRDVGMPWCNVFGMRQLLWGMTDPGAQRPYVGTAGSRAEISGAYEFCN